MSAHRITFRSIVLAIISAAFGAALVAGSAAARPVEGPLGHAAHQVVVASAPGSYHDSIATSTRALPVYHDSIATNTSVLPTYHDSIATTGSATSAVDRVASPTSADSVYRDGSAGPAQRVDSTSNLRGFGSNPKVFTATTHAGSGSSVPGTTWAAIGGGLLLAALITVAVVGLGRRSHAPRRHAPQGTPSFGA